MRLILWPTRSIEMGVGDGTFENGGVIIETTWTLGITFRAKDHFDVNLMGFLSFCFCCPLL